MRYTVVLLIGLGFYLQGCSLLPDVADVMAPSSPTTTATAPTPAAPAVILAPVPATTVGVNAPTTVQLIDILNQAGCDFRAVHLTDGVTRKGSATVAIACK